MQQTNNKRHNHKHLHTHTTPPSYTKALTLIYPKRPPLPYSPPIHTTTFTLTTRSLAYPTPVTPTPSPFELEELDPLTPGAHYGYSDQLLPFSEMLAPDLLLLSLIMVLCRRHEERTTGVGFPLPSPYSHSIQFCVSVERCRCRT